jgi:hypothetical protein
VLHIEPFGTHRLPLGEKETSVSQGISRFITTVCLIAVATSEIFFPQDVTTAPSRSAPSMTKEPPSSS